MLKYSSHCLHFSRISAIILKVSRKLAIFSTLRVNLANPDISRKILLAIR